MGDLQHPVTIWHWKASWQERLDLPAAPPGERESAAQAGMASAHPRTVRDEERFAKEPTFRTGEAVGNLFSQPARQSSVEHLIASGFGTLTTTQAQPVEGRGVWRNGRWHVVMRRLLAPQDAALEVDFRQLVSIPVAFAIWDGSHQERDGMKSVSVWQTLVFPRRTPWWERIRRLIAPPAGLPTASVENHRIQRHAGIVDHGQRVFARLGCAACHGSEGRGGVRNPNALTAEEVPPLIGVAKRFTEEELKEKLLQGAAPARLDPRAPSPGRWMPTWHPVLDDGELEALTAYLVSLVPEDVEAW